jgi:hypothetical protein
MATRVSTLAAATLLLGGLASPASAQRPSAPRPAASAGVNDRRVHLHALGSLPLAAQDFSETRVFREFAEDGRIVSDYAPGRGPGFEGGVQFDITRRWALQGVVSIEGRDDKAAWSAELPHPLHLNRDREVSGEQSGLRHTESAGHLDVVHTFPGRRFDISLFAGPSYVTVKTELIRAVEYRHTYPFDAVTVTGTPTAAHSDSGLGVNGGGALSWKVARQLGLRFQARYTVAKARLVPVEGQTLEIDSGGLSLGIGARLSF